MRIAQKNKNYVRRYEEALASLFSHFHANYQHQEKFEPNVMKRKKRENKKNMDKKRKPNHKTSRKYFSDVNKTISHQSQIDHSKRAIGVGVQTRSMDKTGVRGVEMRIICKQK